MGRIEDALRQAGRQTPETPDEEQGSGLETFPSGPETIDSPVSPVAPVAAVEVREPQAASSGPRELERLVLHRDTEPVVVEQYRRLAAVLHHAQADRGVKVVMLASAQAAEGKTLTAVNLALTLSESYRRRVLLIDADLRRPSVGRLFGVSSTTGLSDCLKSRELQSLRVTNVTDSLGLLLAGVADRDPMAGLTSGRMQEIIEQAAATFDWVILDTPPVGLLTDAHLLAAMVDAAVLVIDAGTTQHAVVQRAIESIGREKIVGVVLNRVADDALADATYYEYFEDSSRKKRRRGYLSGRDMIAEASGTSR